VRTNSFGIQFETPELVVVGMQSDGKSSFIEALLGFQFNIVETSTLSGRVNSRVVRTLTHRGSVRRYWHT
jgi:GTPase SAR1 family protein